MHLFFIRHGETEHNVAGLLAGVTDSRLTNHGVLQTQKLGTSLVKDRRLRFTHVYSSDLQRASSTAREICKAQCDIDAAQRIEVVELEVLREQDFGSLELVSWTSRKADDVINSRTSEQSDPKFKPKETKDAMKVRAHTFLDDYIVPLLVFDHEEPTRVAIVSHGLFLGQLWRVLVSRLGPQSITVSPDIATATPSQPLEHMSWSNTGYLEVGIQCVSDLSMPDPSKVAKSDQSHSASLFSKAKLIIKSINDKRHLHNLKRARGGLGSVAHDRKQQSMNTYFKKRKTGNSTQSNIECSSDKADNDRVADPPA